MISSLFGPIILDLNKPLIMGNGGELSDLEYLDMKTEYTKYLQITDMCTSHLFGPIKQHYINNSFHFIYGS